MKPETRQAAELNCRLLMLSMIPVALSMVCTLIIRENPYAGYLGGLIGAAAGVILCRIFGMHRPFGEQLRSFDVKLCLIYFLLVETGSRLAFSFGGLILSQFLSASAPGTEAPTTLTRVLLIAAVTPVLEELIYRTGMVGVLKKGGSRLISVLYPAVFFMFAHTAKGMQGKLSVLTAGVILALCYYETGNILYPVAAHALHNLAGFADQSFLFRQANGFFVLKTPVLILYGVIFLFSAIRLVRGFRKKHAAEEPQAEQESPLHTEENR